MKLKPFYYLLLIICLPISFGIYHCDDQDEPITPIHTPTSTTTHIISEIATEPIDYSAAVYVYYEDWEETLIEGKELYFVEKYSFSIPDLAGHIVGDLYEELKNYDQFYISAEGLLYRNLKFNLSNNRYLGNFDIQSYEIIHE